MELARQLKIKTGTRLVRLETLGQADQRPVSRATSWFPADRFGDIAEIYRATGSITKAFKELGVPDYVRVVTEITATHADENDLTDLQLSPGAIVLVAQALNADLGNVPVQYSISRFAADRVRFTVEN